MLARLISSIRLLPLLLLIGAGPGDDGRWHAGGYSFSDELGGFLIRAVSGSGTRDDPVVLTQEMNTTGAVVLVIRATGQLAPYSAGRYPDDGYLYLTLETINGSALAWIEYEFELQEILGEPSIYSDGLSFDQRRVGGEVIQSSHFPRHDRAFEPHDRLLFQEGKVDPRETVMFSLVISDLTPRPEFYLVQDPRIPFS